jgi:tetratricopeptide (TPR) repeat protein
MSENNKESLEKILKTITSAEQVIKEVKTSGIDISESEKLLGQAMEAYKEKDDKKVMFFVKKAEALAKKDWKDYYVKLTEETLSSTRKLIDEVKEANLDASEAEDLYNHAIELVEQKNFKIAEEYIKKAVTVANSIWNESRAQVVSDAIASIHALIMEAKEIGVDVIEAEKELLKAITHYKEGEYELADELVKQAVMLSRDSWNNYRAQVASESISDTYNLIMDAKNFGVDTRYAENTLSEAETRFEDNTYDDVEELLSDVEIDIKNRMQESRSKVIENAMADLLTAINEAKEMQADISSAEDLFNQAQEMLRDGDFDSVEDYLKAIESLVYDARKERENEIAAESISSTESMLREIETKVSDHAAEDALSVTQSLLKKLKVMADKEEETGTDLVEEGLEEVSDFESESEMDVEVHWETEDTESGVTADDSEIYEWGATYLCKEKKSQSSFKFYLNLLKGGSRGLCISRLHPDKLSQKYNLTESTIWLSKLPCDNCRNPSNLGKLAFTINQFLDKNPKSTVLLDGLEYLINNNDFQMVLRFIDDIHESIVIHGSIFVIPVSPASYTEREITLLERNSIALVDRIISNTKKFFEIEPFILPDKEKVTAGGGEGGSSKPLKKKIKKSEKEPKRPIKKTVTTKVERKKKYW